jgi:uncharacterized protein
MSKNILITGGTGFVGKRLTNLLLKKGYSVAILTRNPKPNTTNVSYYKWNIDEKFITEKAVLKADFIINLAGENIADKRWTISRKNAILESRIVPIQMIFEVLIRNNKSLEAFISASAVGIYGNDSSSKICTENSNLGTDFLATVCQKWENEVDSISSLNIRTVKIRTGLVVGNGGFLTKLKSLFKYKLGSVLGSGNQFMPWIYLDDLCNMYVYAIENATVSGAFNAAVNDGTTNSSFTKILTKIYGYKVWLPKVPAFILKLVLGEMSNIVLTGKPISCDKIEQLGFEFEYQNLENALKISLEE